MALWDPPMQHILVFCKLTKQDMHDRLTVRRFEPRRV